MTILSWIIWILVGVVLGLMGQRVLGGKRVLSLDVTVGIAGAIIGGWSAQAAIGLETAQNFIIAILCAGLGAAILIWLVGTLYFYFSTRK